MEEGCFQQDLQTECQVCVLMSGQEGAVVPGGGRTGVAVWTQRQPDLMSLRISISEQKRLDKIWSNLFT